MRSPVIAVALAVAVAAAAGACKSRGTITLDFQLGSACGVASPSYVLYAEPRTTCPQCACGACAGGEPDEVAACTGCTADDVRGRELDLSPGLWAVVLEAYGPDGRLADSQCIEATVDADGTSDETVSASGSGSGCCAAD